MKVQFYSNFYGVFTQEFSFNIFYCTFISIIPSCFREKTLGFRPKFRTSFPRTIFILYFMRKRISTLHMKVLHKAIFYFILQMLFYNNIKKFRIESDINSRQKIKNTSRNWNEWKRKQKLLKRQERVIKKANPNKAQKGKKKSRVPRSWWNIRNQKL